MNQRLSLAAIATHLKTQSALAGVHVDTSYARGYLSEFGKTYPAVYVDAQRLSATDDGKAGGSSCYHQRLKAVIRIYLVVQRYADGSVDPEQQLNTLHDAVFTALRNWKPGEAWASLVFDSSFDGDRNESVMTCEMQFSCSVLYTDRP